jgi:hypothetical protein
MLSFLPGRRWWAQRSWGTPPPRGAVVLPSTSTMRHRRAMRITAKDQTLAMQMQYHSCTKVIIKEKLRQTNMDYYNFLPTGYQWQTFLFVVQSYD